MYRETKPREYSMRVEDVAVTIAPQASRSTTSKVNRICDAFLVAMQKDSGARLQNIITAHVCKNPPAVEAGLKVAAALRERNPEEADSAVEHICFLVDVNRVYDCALGLYDLDLALLVAQQSQKVGLSSRT